jgi:hypothetical protein
MHSIQLFASHTPNKALRRSALRVLSWLCLVMLLHPINALAQTTPGIALVEPITVSTAGKATAKVRTTDLGLSRTPDLVVMLGDLPPFTATAEFVAGARAHQFAIVTNMTTAYDEDLAFTFVERIGRNLRQLADGDYLTEADEVGFFMPVDGGQEVQLISWAADNGLTTGQQWAGKNEVARLANWLILTNQAENQARRWQDVPFADTQAADLDLIRATAQQMTTDPGVQKIIVLVSNGGHISQGKTTAALQNDLDNFTKELQQRPDLHIYTVVINPDLFCGCVFPAELRKISDAAQSSPPYTLTAGDEHALDEIWQTHQSIGADWVVRFGLPPAAYFNQMRVGVKRASGNFLASEPVVIDALTTPPPLLTPTPTPVAPPVTWFCQMAGINCAATVAAAIPAWLIMGLGGLLVMLSGGVAYGVYRFTPWSAKSRLSPLASPLQQPIYNPFNHKGATVVDNGTRVDDPDPGARIDVPEAWLELVQGGNGLLESIPLSSQFDIETRLGRDRWTCTDHALLNDERVSSQHCTITKHRDGAYYLVDKKSRNGTFLNHTQVDHLSDPQPLQPGDVIGFGKTISYRFIYTPREQEKQSQASSKETRVE